MTALISGAALIAQVPGFTERLVDPIVFGNFIIRALVLGALYALLAMGFVIIFKATQVLNFAHGTIAAAGAYMTFALAVKFDVPGRFFAEDSWFNASEPGFWSGRVVTWGVALILAALAAGLLGYILERLFIEPMVGEPIFAVAIITLGIEISLRTIYSDFIGTLDKQVGDPWQLGSWQIPVGDGSVTLLYTQPAIVLIAILCALGLAAFFRSKLGVAMRATALDQEAAMVQGIPVNRVFALAWIIGGILAALVGTLAATAPCPCGATKELPFFAFRAFPAVIVGGLDSVVGAAIGGFIVAITEEFAGSYLGSFSNVLGSGFTAVVPYLLMLLVLLVRPYGLFGTKEVRRV